MCFLNFRGINNKKLKIHLNRKNAKAIIIVVLSKIIKTKNINTQNIFFIFIKQKIQIYLILALLKQFISFFLKSSEIFNQFFLLLFHLNDYNDFSPKSKIHDTLRLKIILQIRIKWRLEKNVSVCHEFS